MKGSGGEGKWEGTRGGRKGEDRGVERNKSQAKISRVPILQFVFV